MNRHTRFSVLVILSLSSLALHANQLTLTVVNELPISRASETVEMSAEDLASLGNDLQRIRVKDASGRELLCQAVDTDGNHEFDQVIFQSDFGPRESKTFTVTAGAKWQYTKDQFKAYGRFVRERFDDFAWENDRIAHRTYGKALETWEKEPLSSSTVDIWSKRTPRMVINEWYMTDDYHVDHGEGADFYSAGLSRGNGGSGLWADNRLWVSRNFVDSRVLANGPIRVVFELTYEPFNVNGVSVAEVKRVTLDAGSHLDHYQSTYKPYIRPGRPVTLTAAAGLKKVAGEQKEFNAERGWLVKWEAVEKNAGNQGVALLVDPTALVTQTEDELNLLMLMKVPESNVISYRAGFCWDRAGHITSPAAWKQYVDEAAQRIASPLKVTLSR